ncbi:MAG: anaerobic sulfite reductase subunit AsrA [Clostridia bacterium]|nr:anaerobic sulfite reductase subunit AsrA [Clostridia bacterium]
MNDNELLKARLAYYSFFSRVFEKELTEDKLGQLAAMKSGTPTGNEDIDKGFALLQRFFAQAPENRADELAADFARIFLAAGQAKGKAAFPYESIYTSKEKLLMQDAWEKMAGLFRAKGLSLSGVSADIKEDHIAAELLYAAHLAKESGAAEQLSFLEEHLLNWVPAFLADINAVAAYDLYKGLGQMLLGFLLEEQAYLTQATAKAESSDATLKSYSLSTDEMDRFIAGLKTEYRVYAPKIVTHRGSTRQVIRFQEISSVREIYNEDNSDFSPKEIYYPISQTMFYFTESEVTESRLKDDKGIVLIMHPCDINALRRLDNIFLHNGGEDNADMYYERLRRKVKIFMLECKQSGNNCFCVSMNSNRADNYDLALRLGDNAVMVQVQNPEWNRHFSGCTQAAFEPRFVTENRRSVHLPQIDGIEDVKLASALPYWSKFDDKCISCGGCNTVCPTCSCFDTVDVIYNETSRDGERRRVWSSCMLDTFTMTAGGARARKTPGANMRFKALHKAYDYGKRFDCGENMCVGCGRCITRCPKELDFADTLNEFADALAQAKKGGE